MIYKNNYKLEILYYFIVEIYLYIIIVNANQIIIKTQNLESLKINKRNLLPEGFLPLNENELDGPITINREKDNGKKRNLYKMIRKENESLNYYNYDEFNKLEIEKEKKSEYFCELQSSLRTEVLEGYELSCPEYYTIVIDKAFYGRYANDFNNCKPKLYKKEFNKVKKIKKIKKLIKKKNCGYEPTKKVKYSCEGRSYCKLFPNKSYFKDKCFGFSKYLHIVYHCKKIKELKKEKISIVSFYDEIDSNSIQEHSISEFYQYANIHGYEFELKTLNYIPERVVYFMKLEALIDKLIEGLKYNKFDWIVWVDSDIIIQNPNIKLEFFLPGKSMNKVHLIAAYDYSGRKDYCCGINTGVLFIRVHEWSLNILMRAMTYPYYNKEKLIELPDQTALNNILIEFNEYEHFITVPQEWFNNSYIKKGNFLYHIMGGNQKNKNVRLYKFLNSTENNEEWYTKTNKEIKQEVIEYYNLSKENQIRIKLQP